MRRRGEEEGRREERKTAGGGQRAVQPCEIKCESPQAWYNLYGARRRTPLIPPQRAVQPCEIILGHVLSIILGHVLDDTRDVT
eukprot:2888024-Rhodomonas_salina.1